MFILCIIIFCVCVSLDNAKIGQFILNRVLYTLISIHCCYLFIGILYSRIISLWKTVSITTVNNDNSNNY